MKTPMLKNRLWNIIPALLSFFPRGTYIQIRGGVVQTYKNATVPFDDQKQVDAVLPLAVKSVQVTEKYQGGRFRTETRKDKLQRFSCSQCHNNKPVTIRRAAEVAHGDIVLNHGSEAQALILLYLSQKR